MVSGGPTDSHSLIARWTSASSCFDSLDATRETASEVITLSHTLLGSPRESQGVPKESPRSTYGPVPSIALVLPDSKDSLRTPQGLLKDFIGSPQGVPRDSLYNPHKEGTFPGVPLQSHWD